MSQNPKTKTSPEFFYDKEFLVQTLEQKVLVFMIFICNKFCANIDQIWQTQTDLIISSLKIKEFSQKLETSFR